MKLIIYLVLMNILAFILYGLDKSFARKHRRRIPENVLFGVAVIGGGLGSYAGMMYFRHKTKKDKFKYGVPFVTLVHILMGIAIIFMILTGTATM